MSTREVAIATETDESGCTYLNQFEHKHVHYRCFFKKIIGRNEKLKAKFTDYLAGKTIVPSIFGE